MIGIPQVDIDDCIVWQDEFGYLPGCSSVRFVHDDNDNLLLATEENIEEFQKRQKKMKEECLNPENLDASICLRCMKTCVKADLVKSNTFCRGCAEIDTALYKIYLSLSSQNVLRRAYEFARAQELKLRIKNDYLYLNEFEWEEYLRRYDHLAANPETFYPWQTYPNKTNEFEVGMKLEGVDPSRASKFCVMTVVEKLGFRIRLHFDGYNHRFDFWVNADSPFIFPVGYCEKNGRKLQPPLGMNSFDWKDYLATTGSVAAPENLFEINNQKKSKETNGFEINQKLEAIDYNNEMICVATIKDILPGHLLIHFDGWDNSFDFWTSTNSAYIHPVHWCKSQKGRKVVQPKGFTEPVFIWEDYLKKTNSKPAPAHLFCEKPNSPLKTWKQGLRLEAVDRRNPDLIRVASVVGKTKFNRIKIHFDGWDDYYDHWMPEDSPDLHPINWCQKTGHPLEPPPNKYFVKINTICPLIECNGYGHVRWYKYKSHSEEIDCPYSDAYYEPETIEKYESKQCSLPSDDDDDEKVDLKFFIQLTEKICPYLLKSMKDNYLEMKRTRKDVAVLTKMEEFMDSLNLEPLEIALSDCNGIYNFINKFTNNEETAQIFKEEEIDGISFLCLKQDDFIKRLKKIKLNHSIKIVSLIFYVLKKIFKDVGY